MLKKKKMKNKEKQIYNDDGHTIYNMDVEHLKNRRPKKITLNNKERFALIKAAFQRFLPILFGVILCFGIAMLLIYLWLN